MSKREIVEYMGSEIVRERFADALGNPGSAGAYVNSVLMAVANSPNLQECTYESIYISALRAATLRLSCDPGTKQAWLVPYGKKAILIIGYKGLLDMAVRTGRYRYIHTDKLYVGENVEVDRFTGQIKLVGGKETNTVYGWLASFQMYDGYSKSIFMTVDEIHEHAKKYSKGYKSSDSAWKTAPEQMERKTILRKLLMDWGYIDPADAALIEPSDDQSPEDIPDIVADETIEGEVIETDETPEKILGQLGFGDA